MTNPETEYLESLKSKTTGEPQEILHTIGELFHKKNWHQLTQVMIRSLDKDSFLKALDLMEFYEKFVSKFEHRLNALNLAQIMIPMADSVEPAQGLQFLKTFKAKRLGKEGTAEKTESEKEALILINAALIRLGLKRKDDKGKVAEVEEVRDLVEGTEKAVEELSGVVPLVNGAFYKAHAAFLCEVADHAGYYRETLRYLGCVDAEKDLKEEERLVTAQRLCVSALVGKDVYNFGELLAHPIVRVLEGNPAAWLLDLVRAFNCGNVEAFVRMEPTWRSCVDIARNKDALMAKLQLLTIMETAFARPPHQRRVPFADLAAKLSVSEKEVQLLVMRAFSRNLVKGSIDAVDKTVLFTWVQPRVLDKNQIVKLKEQMEEISTSVKETLQLFPHMGFP